MIKNKKSSEIFDKAQQYIPGGVNSPVRAFKSIGGKPFIVDKGTGAYLYDIDGNRFTDYVMSWGPLILGHAHKPVIEAITKAALKGSSFGASTKAELELAMIVNELMPWVEKLRTVSSGTEACMTAIRLARGATGRQLVVKFDGGYHGHSDAFLVKAGSGLATGGLPASGGVPEKVTEATLSLPYNDIEKVKQCFAEKGNDIAAVIVEPVAANMGVIPPTPGFLQGLRDLTREHKALLIFDEVITGFRVARGGAAELFDIKPDLVCLGKILGGGMPIGGVGGNADIMDYLAPEGPVYQAGTLSGNPLSTAAGIETLKSLDDHRVYTYLKQYTDDLTGEITSLFDKSDIDIRLSKVESLFTLFFAGHDIYDFDSVNKANMNMYSEFFTHMLNRGVYLPPSGYEAWFVSTAHQQEQLEYTINAIRTFIDGRPE